MPIVSGGGGASGPAAGSYLPVADKAGVTVDSTTYSNPITGVGKLATLVAPADTGVVALAVTGDAFPRIIYAFDASDYALVSFGDGTSDPVIHGSSLSGSLLEVRLATGGSAQTMSVGKDGNQRGRVLSSSTPIMLNGTSAMIAAGTGVPAIGGIAGDLFIRTDGANGTLILYRCTATGTAGNATWVPVLTPGSPVGIVTSGALSTVQLVTATGAQILTSRDAETVTPCTFNPGAATTATVTVALSPDNVTYSTLGIETEPAGVAFDGTIHLIKVRVPAGWYLKLTVNAQATLGLTTYY